MSQPRDVAAEAQGFLDWMAARLPETVGHGSPAGWECDYPGWRGLYASVEQALRSPMDDATAELVLQVMSWDNETEVIADWLEGSPAHVRTLLDRALAHPDPTVRWQFARVLSYALGAEARAPLGILQQDPDAYVRRIAGRAADRVEALAAHVPLDGLAALWDACQRAVAGGIDAPVAAVRSFATSPGDAPQRALWDIDLVVQGWITEDELPALVPGWVACRGGLPGTHPSMSDRLAEMRTLLATTRREAGLDDRPMPPVTGLPSQ